MAAIIKAFNKSKKSMEFTFPAGFYGRTPTTVSAGRQASKRWDGRNRKAGLQLQLHGQHGWHSMRRHCSDPPYNCPVMDVQRSGSLADWAPAPSRRLPRSLHALQATVRARQLPREAIAAPIMCHADVAMFMHGNGMDGWMDASADGDDDERGQAGRRSICLGPREGKPPTRDPIKMWCGESDFEPRIRKFVSYVTPQSLRFGSGDVVW
jgi:hypothetical protein